MQPISSYDFQVVQIPLRTVLHENAYSHLRYFDIEGHKQILELAKASISRYFDILIDWNRRHHLLTFLVNFLVPQQNPAGRLLPRHEPTNLCYIVEKLNEHLSSLIAMRTNAYLIDADQIAAGVGKAFLLDDSVLTISHGALVNDALLHLDQARITPARPLFEAFRASEGRKEEFFDAGVAELEAGFRTARGHDAVKLVIFDLDDTLWRGIAAEQDEITYENIEGWPTGLMEAACFLKKRGVLLAIVSKNDESRIVDLFPKVVGGRIHFDDFAVREISFGSKVEAVDRVIRNCNLLPKSVVFIDDNPVERDAVQTRFPDLRVLGADLYAIRRVLLWSSETQVAEINAEGENRAQSIAAQVDREASRADLSHDDFLRSLNIAMTVREIGVEDPAFGRVHELVNKTNQFNTTGRRWSREEMTAFVTAGGVTHAFWLTDRHSSYGLVGVALSRDGSLVQMVMSCRVFGLHAEHAFLWALMTRFGLGRSLDVRFEATKANMVCASFLGSVGTLSGDAYRVSLADLDPGSVNVVEQQ